VLADATRLPFPDASFDCVVDTFSLCVMEDPLAALREVRRVLRPGGAALLAEHTRSAEAPLLGWYQSVTAAPVRATAKGCDWSQDALGLVERAGFDVRRAEPSLVGLLTTIEATPRPRSP
jgi:ubiquinone/menaquinone biosynthesis C-methylase UbiE